MERIDARKHKSKVQQQLRNQAIHLRTTGWSYTPISEAVGVNVSTVAKWCRAYKKGGEKAIRIQKRGRKEGEKRTLNPEQERQVQRFIRDKCPEQLKLPFGLDKRFSSLSNGYLQSICRFAP